LVEEYKALFLAHVEATPPFELGKEAFACIGIFFSIMYLLKLIMALKRSVSPQPPKQFFQ